MSGGTGVAPGQGPEGRTWILAIVSTAGAPPSTRVAVWRKLKALGALYLQQSVAMLPAVATTRRAIAALTDRVERDGGSLRALTISLPDPQQEQRLIDELRGERDAEYAEVLERFPEFFAELDHELGRGRATYEELEESEADLARFDTWLGRIRARDYFDAPQGASARAEYRRAEEALAAFADAAVAAHEREARQSGDEF